MSYRIIFSLTKNLYSENSPIIISAGSLVQNTENGNLHVQLKFKNLSDRNVLMLKVELVLTDSINREIARQEKQYVDLNAKLNDSFCDKIPVFINEKITRKFYVNLKEVCFSDGNVWTPNENSIWENLPEPSPLSKKFRSMESIEEFKSIYCKKATFTPFTYKDLWICACGNVNKHFYRTCTKCYAERAKMEAADPETLRKNNVYDKAVSLIDKDYSSSIKQGITLLETLNGWKDSDKKLEDANLKLVIIEKNEKDEREKQQDEREKQKERRKRIKKISIRLIISTIIALLAFFIGFTVINRVTQSNNANNNANKYAQAVEYMEQYDYGKAAVLFKELEDYEDSRELYLKASAYADYISRKDYKGLIDKYNLTEFTIPQGTTEIPDTAFFDCRTLKNITIPDSVTYIGSQAFANCVGLTSVVIPTNVTYIGKLAFYGCNNLKSVTIPESVVHIDYKAFADSPYLTIYCEASREPSGWVSFWNKNIKKVVWGYKEK